MTSHMLTQVHRSEERSGDEDGDDFFFCIWHSQIGPYGECDKGKLDGKLDAESGQSERLARVECVQIECGANLRGAQIGPSDALQHKSEQIDREPHHGNKASETINKTLKRRVGSIETSMSENSASHCVDGYSNKIGSQNQNNQLGKIRCQCRIVQKD